MYPIRRNYSGSLTAIDIITQARPTHSWVYQVSREIRKEDSKPMSLTIELHEFQWPNPA